MIGCGLGFLNSRNISAGRKDEEVHGFGATDGAAVVADEGNRQQALSLCLLQRLQDIWGIAAGGNAHSDVLGLTVGDDLAEKDALVADIVADRCDDGGVIDKGDGRQRTPVRERRVEEIGDDILGVGGAATVTECQQFAASGEALRHRPRRLHQCLSALGESCLPQFGDIMGFLDGGGDDAFQDGCRVNPFAFRQEGIKLLPRFSHCRSRPFGHRFLGGFFASHLVERQFTPFGDGEACVHQKPVTHLGIGH